MTLAQRVRDFRYSKGWGPDELAARAEISRTALYQIESGKTGLPRAGTLRRIAVALDVSMDDLLGHEEVGQHGHGRPSTSAGPLATRSRELSDWIPEEGGPLSLPSQGHGSYSALGEEKHEDVRFAVESHSRSLNGSFEGIVMREGEMMSKLHDLLHSSLGSGVVRVIEELHAMIPRHKGAL